MSGIKVNTRKVIVILLCFLLVFTMIPTIAMPTFANTATDTRVVDENTMDTWQDYFGSGVNNTLNAGGIWTDKSVFANDIPREFTSKGISIDETKNTNFLVAMSTLASNKQIVGYSHIPTDTMLVLDLSGSMSATNVAAMVTATNNAIKTLQETNNYNRVGVVLYSGNSNFGDSDTSTATVLLPLDRYTTGDDDRYIQYNTGADSVSVDYDTRGASNPDVRITESKTASGGTYIQNGVYKAWQAFENIADTDTIIQTGIQAGTKRMPILVLMSDGAPTAATNAFDNVGTSNAGRGAANNSDGMGFLSQLTLAWVREKLEEKYERTAMVYTLGLGLESIELSEGRNIATSVLDPNNSTNGIINLWARYISANNSISIEVPNNMKGGGTKSFNVNKNSLLTSTDQMNYVDEFFSASDAAELNDAFEAIVQEIIIQSKYYPTMSEDGQQDIDGYVHFEDDLGSFMEVKDIKGLVIGEQYFTGQRMAEIMTYGDLGTVENPNPMGDEFIWSIKERLNVTTQQARDLVVAAHADGQIGVHTINGVKTYENHMSWYADANYNYLGFYSEKGTSAKPANAKYIIQSYGYLGEEAITEESVKAADMMYMTVRVKTDLETGLQSVHWNVPASLIPTVTYEIELEGESYEDAKNITMDVVPANPVRLVYEVGLKDDINELNVAEKMAAADHKHPDGNGGYYFYSNMWDITDSEGNLAIGQQNPTTHKATTVMFEPSVNNERYYYAEDTLVYARSGNTYTPVTYDPNDSEGIYYHARHVFEKTGSGKSAVLNNQYEAISGEALSTAIQKGGNYYIPKGTIQRKVMGFVDEKTTNSTGTLGYVNYPLIYNPTPDTNEDYHVDVFLGNNGRLNLVPATGIKLTKTIDVVQPGTSTEDFEFEITFDGDMANKNLFAHVFNQDGIELEEKALVTDANKKVSIILDNGQTAYITGITAGVNYTIAENAHGDYAPKKVTVNGTVENELVATNTITDKVLDEVVFENTLKTHGNLVINKTITHPYGNSYVMSQETLEKKFPVEIQLTGTDVEKQKFNYVSSVSGEGIVESDSQGKITLQIQHNEIVSIQGITTGATYVVTEPGYTSTNGGYKLITEASELTGTIIQDANANVNLVNEYTPTNVPLDGNESLILNVIKEITGREWLPNESFDFVIEKFDGSNWVTLREGTATENNPSFDETIFGGENASANEVYNNIGTYQYRVREVIPTQMAGGMTYDTSIHNFNVVVTDIDMDGALEINKVAYGDGTEVAPEVNGVEKTYTVNVNFDNKYAPTEGAFITVNIQKVIRDLANTGKLPAGFEFGIYEGNRLVSTSTTTENDGIATLVKNYYPSDLAGAKSKTFTYTLKEIIPQNADKIPGMIYSTQEYELVVTVVDNLDGTLSATYSLTDDANLAVPTPSFINTFDLGTVGIELNAKKTLVNMTNADNPVAMNFDEGDFYFDLYAADEQFAGYGAPLQSVTTTDSVDGSADITFSYLNNLEFSQIGTYKYVIKERIPTTGQGTNGITYDTTEHRVEVVVTEKMNGDVSTGTLEAKVFVDGNLVGDQSQSVITFANTYRADAIGLSFEGTKILTGRAPVGGEFFFTLFETDENFADPEKIQTVSNVTSTPNDRFFFDEITYTEDGTHYYVVKETDENGNALQTTSVKGVTYDQTEYKLKVVVTDTTQGQHTVSIQRTTDGNTYSDFTDDGLAFTNAYVPTKANINLSNKVTKTLEGRDLEGGEFTFKIYDSERNEVASGTNAAANEGEAATVTFDNTLTFDRAGTYYYTLKEVQGDKGGVTYDEYVYNIIVTVTDNLQGQLVASYVVDGDENNPNKSVSFGNVYTTTPAKVTLEASKVLEGRNLEAREFWFELRNAETKALVQEKKNNAATADSNKVATGLVTFDAITFDEVGEYTYTIAERNEHKSGITYDSQVYRVTISVTDNGVGQLVAAVKVNDKAVNDLANIEDVIKFTNKDPEDGKVTFRGLKTLSGRDLAADEFEFELYQTNALYLNKELKETVKNKADGTFAFNEITYDTAGTYYYVVEEKVDASKEAEGIVYDTEYFKIKVTVTGQTNKLNVVYETILVDGIFSNTVVSTIQFDNEYAPTPISVPVSSLMTATKTIEGRDLEEGEFEFQVLDKDGEVVSTGTNAEAEEGEAAVVTFDEALEFTKAGTYKFTIIEVEEELAGVTYDETAYELTIKIVDDGKGKLSVAEESTTLTAPNATVETAEFNNTYKPEPIEIDFIYNVNKILEGRDIKAGEFEFELYDLNGETPELLQTKTNEAPKVDGKAGIDFDPVTFELGGTYKFKIVEKNNGVKAVDYSDAEYIYTVEIADNGKAKLTVDSIKCTLDGVEKPAHFTNVYRHTDIEIAKTQAVNDGTATKLKTEAKAGDIITYFLTVTNNGNVPAYNLEIADKVPAGLEVVKDSITADGVLSDDGTIKWTLDKLDGQTAEGDASAYVVSFKVKVPEVKQATTWTNVATVTFDDPSEDPEEPENKTKESNVVEVEVARPLPDTGDHSGVGLWTAIAALAATGFVGLNIKRKEE